eukprot:46456-Eustigmatos_ZCMA.PRE.1
MPGAALPSDSEEEKDDADALPLSMLIDDADCGDGEDDMQPVRVGEDDESGDSDEEEDGEDEYEGESE